MVTPRTGNFLHIGLRNTRIGTLLDLNRHELIYQFDFSVISELTEDDTRQQDDLNSLDELRTLAIDVDYLDPGNGPDGDIEHHTEITLPS